MLNRPRRLKHIAVGGVLLAVISWLRPLRRVVVTGDSMRPALDPGDRLFVVRTRRVRVGDLVAVPDPRMAQRLLVKRVASATRRTVVVLGDNLGASTDSRTFGPVARSVVVGRAVYRYGPRARRGPLR
ncbi:MAG: nickel-type superoxide dismutase maturation protease [Acidimicrobiales bacterium]